MSDALRAAMCAIDGVIESPSMFKDDDGYWVNGTEIAHFEADDAIDLRLTRRVIGELRAELGPDPRVERRRSGSDWVTVRFAVGDHAFVVGLVERAAVAHRAPPGTIPKPPPTGVDLARRRRFH